MSFLAPYMLLGTAAAAVPIVIHFFFRSRYKTVKWAAMDFLLTSIEQTSRRVKFQELLLLLLRCLILILLALALARPLSSVFVSGGGRGQGEAVHAVLLIDTSYSMGIKDGEETRLERAKTAALKIIDELPPYSTVQIVTCADRATLLGPRSPGNLGHAKTVIEDLKITSLRTDFLPGVQEVEVALKTSQLLTKEVYLFSDMQKLGWNAQADSLAKQLKKIDKDATIFLVHCEGETPEKNGNASIIDVVPLFGIPKAQERLEFAVMVRNTGKKTLRNVDVTLTVNGKDGSDRQVQRANEQPGEIETGRIKTIAPDQTRAITLTALMPAVGSQVVSAQTMTKYDPEVGEFRSIDDLATDNRFDRILNVQKQINVLVIDGSMERDNVERASFPILNALDPYAKKRPYDPIRIPPRKAVPALLRGTELVVLCDVGVSRRADATHEFLKTEFLKALNRYVRDGGSLMIFPGTNFLTEEYNNVFVEQYNFLPFRLTKIRDLKTEHDDRIQNEIQLLKTKGKWTPQAEKDLLAQKPSPLHLSRETANLPPFQRFKEDKAHEDLNFCNIWRVVEMDESKIIAKKSENTKNPEAEKTAAKKYTDAKLSKGVVVAMRYDKAKKKGEKPRPAIVVNKVGDGRVVFFTTGPALLRRKNSNSLLWGTWSVTLSFMPMLRTTVAYLLEERAQSRNLTAGTKHVYRVPQSVTEKSFVLVPPDGRVERLGNARRKNKRATVSLFGLNSNGVYGLVSIGSEQILPDYLRDEAVGRRIEKGNLPNLVQRFAVTPDFAETASGNLESASEADINKALGFKVIHVKAGSETGTLDELERTNREWTIWFLLGVVLFVLVELIFAWFCGRPVGASR
ncbi:MAG: BatA domain-containing protein [Gemmataceae bacterium]